MTPVELSFKATDAKGEVDALLLQARNPFAILVLGHGAGANMRHIHMESIANGLAEVHVSTLRFNFPFMQAGGGRTDPIETCLETIQGALALARESSNSPMFLGGHSFGGRMASHYAATRTSDLRGLVYFSFPLHPARKPDTRRADHLPDVRVPQLFLSGTRDALAELELLTGVVSGLVGAELHTLDTADHGFKVLKRSRTSAEDVYSEASRVASAFMGRVTGND